MNKWLNRIRPRKPNTGNKHSVSYMGMDIPTNNDPSPDGTYIFCWNCDKKIDDEAQTCPHCNMPQFDKNGDEIIDREAYEARKLDGSI